jgi:DNA-binding MarR family transcriptional regulator
MADELSGGDAEEWDQIGYIISSKYRLAVFEQLVEAPATPSSIASRSDLRTTHISRALRGFAERSLVELLVSSDTKKGRLYGVTDRGKQLWQRIEREGMVD